MKKIGVVILLSLLVLTGCSPKEDTSNTFTVGMECGYAPYNWTEPSKTDSAVQIDGGQYCDGYDVQIGKIIADKLGKTLVIKKLSWEGLILSLQTGQIDAIIAGMSPTEERKKEVTFGESYMDNALVILSRSDDPITTISELEGKDVAVETQSSGQSALEKNDIYDKLKEMQKYTNIQDALLALNAKTVDAIVADVTFAGFTLAKDPTQYVISDETFDSEYYAIGFRKDDDDSFKDAVDAAISQLIESGVAKEISEKWLGKDLIKRP